METITEKKKRGRPAKIKDNAADTLNEKREEIKMVESNAISQEALSVQQVQNRWQNLFNKYSTMGFESVYSGWKQSMGMLSNPFIQNERVKKINSSPVKLSKESLQEAMFAPDSSEDALRRTSMYIYYTNYMYNLLVKLNRDTPRYFYYATPLYVDEKDVNSEAFKKESRQVDRILKTFDPKLTFKTIATQVALEGKSSYLFRKSFSKDSVDFFIPQKLDSDMIKITGFGSKQQFIVSFNMMIFLQPAYDLSQYPKYIQDVWDDMINTKVIEKTKKGNYQFNPKANIPSKHIIENIGGNYMYWVELPQSLCYTFYSDGSNPMSFPDAIGLFSDFNDLGDYRWLQANLLSKGINSIVTAEVPIAKNAAPGTDATIISPDVVLGYQDLFANSISGNILPFFGPFTDFKLHNLQNQPESMNVIFNRTRDLIATSGNSALMSITDKPSIASVKASQTIQAARNDYLTRQFQKFLNNVLNSQFNLKYKWNVTLWGDAFNWRDDVKITKELVLSGVTGLIPKLLSAQDTTLEDYAGSTLYLNSLNIKLDSKSASEKDSAPVGRPKIDDGDIENDNTGISADAGNNVSDIKEFHFDTPKCLICGAELTEDEDTICDSCIEEKLEERL